MRCASRDAGRYVQCGAASAHASRLPPNMFCCGAGQQCRAEHTGRRAYGGDACQPRRRTASADSRGAAARPARADGQQGAGSTLAPHSEHRAAAGQAALKGGGGARAALVEALMGFQFNHVGGGTKTRRPITLHMKYNCACVQPNCYLLTEDAGEQEVTLEELQARPPALP